MKSGPFLPSFLLCSPNPSDVIRMMNTCKTFLVFHHSSISVHYHQCHMGEALEQGCHLVAIILSSWQRRGITRNRPKKGSDWSTKSVTGYTTVKWRGRLLLSWNSMIPCHQYDHPLCTLHNIVIMSLASLHIVMCKSCPNTPIPSSDIYIMHTAVKMNPQVPNLF